MALNRAILDVLAGELCWCGNGIIDDATRNRTHGIERELRYDRWMQCGLHCAVCHTDLPDHALEPAIATMQHAHESFCPPYAPEDTIATRCPFCEDIVTGPMADVLSGVFFDATHHDCRRRAP